MPSFTHTSTTDPAVTSALQTAEIDLLLVQGAAGELGDIGSAPVQGGPARTASPTASPR